MKSIVIIADDLTGAVDTTACLTRYGATNIVSLSPDAPVLGDEQVHAINAATRERKLQEARDVHRNLCNAVDMHGRIIIKKTDMGFRGNHGGEIEGLLLGLDADVCYVVNSIPDHKAFVLDGRQYVKSKLLTQSMYAQDPSHNPKTSDISEILGEQTRLPIGNVKLEKLRTGQTAGAVHKLVREGKRILIFDVMNEQDCDAIVRTTLALPYRAIWAGTLGLMDALGRNLFTQEDRVPTLREHPPRCLCFSGSNYSTVQRQIQSALQTGLLCVPLDMDKCLAADEEKVEEIRRCIALCRTHNQRENVLLTLHLSPENKRPGIGKVLLDIFTDCAKQLCDLCHYERLVIIGGETTAAIFNALHVERLTITACLETGVALGHLDGGPYNGLSFACKGGSVGTDDALCKMLFSRLD